MTIQELMDQLSTYPRHLDLSEIKTMVSVEKVIGCNRIQCVYIANQRIAGGHPWGVFAAHGTSNQFKCCCFQPITRIKTQQKWYEMLN